MSRAICIAFILVLALTTIQTATGPIQAASTSATASAGIPKLPRPSAQDGISPKQMVQSIKAARAGVPPDFRGPLEQSPIRAQASAVVLIVTPNKLATGTVIDAQGTILTAAHVIEGFTSLGVIFKPRASEHRPKETDAVSARVIKVDQLNDLALLKLSAVSVPQTPIRISPAFNYLGPIHAVGHPFGEIWSYTTGSVRRFVPRHEWTGDDKLSHRARALEVTTDVRPGTSGAAILNPAGDLVGIVVSAKINDPKTNFAVATVEISDFLRRSQSRYVASPAVAPAQPNCQPLLSTGRASSNRATVHSLDLDCNGKQDARLEMPDDRRLPAVLSFDSDENGRVDTYYFDNNRDGAFDVVHFDTNEDGKIDLVGHDLDENLQPRRMTVPER